MLFKKKFFGAKSTYDYLLVGLGNPGDKYKNTRHNAGFCTLDAFCKQHSCEMKKLKYKSLCGECTVQNKRIMLIKPQTFMNNSGEAVKAVMDFYKLSPEQVIIVFDDISLEVSKLRIRRKGSHGGHNGIKDIIELCGSEDFPRIKVGVGHKPEQWDLADWVLSEFKAEDAKAISESFENAAKAAECIITKDIDTAMNKYSK